MNLPNKLTLLRVMMIPVFLFLLLAGTFGAGRQMACGVFVAASLTDWLDGYIARKYRLVTNFGKFMDPLADKLLVSSALIALLGLGEIGAVALVVLISREFIVTGFRLVAAERQVVIAAGGLGKLKTATQMVMIVVVLLKLPFGMMPLVENALIWLSVLFSAASAVEYIVVNREILKDN